MIEIGKTIREYKILSEIGKGEGGYQRLILPNIHIEKKVGIKALLPHLHADKQLRRRFVANLCQSDFKHEILFNCIQLWKMRASFFWLWNTLWCEPA